MSSNRKNTPTKDVDVYKSPVDKVEALMQMCEIWAEARSKDPRTAVGAVVYHRPTGAMHFGYNGFPKHVKDLCENWDDREIKHSMVTHAETNAIRRAHVMHGEDLSDCFIVVTKQPCEVCLRAHIAPAGLRQVYYKPSTDDKDLTVLSRRLGVYLLPQATLVYTDECPDGYKAVEDTDGCIGCAFFRRDDCEKRKCTEDERRDGRSVIFVPL